MASSMRMAYLRKGYSFASACSLPAIDCCPRAQGERWSKTEHNARETRDVHYLWLQLDEEPREQGKLLIVHQLVLDRVQAVVLVTLESVGQLLISLRVGLGLGVAQHGVTRNVHRVPRDVVAHEPDPVRHVVVLTAPAPEKVGESWRERDNYYSHSVE